MKNSTLSSYFNRAMSFLKYGIFSEKIRIEASSICQLDCHMCQQKDLKKIIGKGYLKFEDFKRFVDKYPNFKYIELSNYGEIFLNPELKSIIEYAHKKDISLTAHNGVNLNALSEDMAESLAKHRFKAMRVSIDGATNEVYKIYRKNGDLNKVITNIKKINKYKAKYNTEFPRLTWVFILFGHNEHELSLARKLAKELNMQFRPAFNFNPEHSPVKDIDLIKKELGFATIKEYSQKTGKPFFLRTCRQLWFEPQINWDGKLLGCCCNGWKGDFGNVFSEGLKECLKSERYIYAKKMLLGKKKPRHDIPCSKCDIYKKLRKNGKVLKLSDNQKSLTKRIALDAYENFISAG